MRTMLFFVYAVTNIFILGPVFDFSRSDLMWRLDGAATILFIHWILCWLAEKGRARST